MGAAALLPVRPAAAAAGGRSLSFHNLHTGERLTATYWERGRYLDDALAQIDWILRDHRSGEVAEIDRGLLDLLHRLQAKLGGNRRFEVISGYRSPATNAMLASASGGVARKSLHVSGKAIDIRVSGIRLAALRDASKSLKGGGVGYYARSRFVHVDVGRVRYW